MLYPIQEEATVLIAIKSKSLNKWKKMRKAVTNYTYILTQKEKSTVSANIFWKDVAVLYEQIRSISAPILPKRDVHGSILFGRELKKVFGIAT